MENCEKFNPVPCPVMVSYRRSFSYISMNCQVAHRPLYHSLQTENSSRYHKTVNLWKNYFTEGRLLRAKLLLYQLTSNLFSVQRHVIKVYDQTSQKFWLLMRDVVKPYATMLLFNYNVFDDKIYVKLINGRKNILTLLVL